MGFKSQWETKARQQPLMEDEEYHNPTGLTQVGTISLHLETEGERAASESKAYVMLTST
jgi:hypothetical protein